MKNNQMGIQIYRRKFAIFPGGRCRKYKSTLIIKAPDARKLLCGQPVIYR